MIVVVTEKKTKMTIEHKDVTKVYSDFTKYDNKAAACYRIEFTNSPCLSLLKKFYDIELVCPDE